MISTKSYLRSRVSELKVIVVTPLKWRDLRRLLVLVVALDLGKLKAKQGFCRLHFQRLSAP